MSNVCKVKLTFMVPGFSKCGTTMLCALLAEHPDIYIPEVKETYFFSQYDYDQKWDEYNAFFTTFKGEKAVGEGTTFYSAYDHEKGSRDRILKVFPDIRMIFIARHPLKRIESSYREFHNSGVRLAVNTPFGLNAAMREFPAAFIEDTKYWQRINNYREVMGDDRILVVFLEDVMRDHFSVFRRCYEFLGVDPAFASQLELKKYNSAEEKLYDSRLLRWMRTNQFWGNKIAKLSPDQQDSLFYWIGLRKRFKRPIVWDEESLLRVAQEISGDSENFLKFYLKPADFWSNLPTSKTE